MAFGFPTETFSIGPDTYIITALPASVGRPLYLQLAQAIASALSDGTERGGAALIAGAVAGVSAELFDRLCTTMAERTVLKCKDGAQLKEAVPLDPATFDMHFACRYQAMVEWLVKCLQFNHMLDFLPAGLLTGLPVEGANATTG
jgi:hypothetical protein